MRRSSLVSLVLAALALGCAPTNPGLTIDGVIAASDMCDYSASGAFIVEAVLDTTVDVPAIYRPGGIRYVAVLRVGNHLINTGNSVYPLRADTSVITIEGAEVEVLNTDGTVFSFPGLPNPYRVTATGTVGSTTGNEATLGLTTAEILPPQYGAALGDIPSGTLIFSIRVLGVTSGGSGITSGRFLLPIRLCAGCMYPCYHDSMDVPIQSLSCLPGQDAQSSICPTEG